MQFSGATLNVIKPRKLFLLYFRQKAFFPTRCSIKKCIYLCSYRMKKKLLLEFVSESGFFKASLCRKAIFSQPEKSIFKAAYVLAITKPVNTHSYLYPQPARTGCLTNSRTYFFLIKAVLMFLGYF